MHTVILGSQRQRDTAKSLIDRAPPMFVVQIREQKRTSEQSDKMWAMLGDISRAKPFGRRHTPDDWKAILMNACGWECQFIEGLDGRPFPQGFRSSQLTKSQMSTLIEYMLAFGAEHGVAWSNEPASVDSRPEGGDALAAPFTTSAVAEGQTPITHCSNRDIPHG